jgi:hypothetical protein
MVPDALVLDHVLNSLGAASYDLLTFPGLLLMTVYEVILLIVLF